MQPRPAIVAADCRTGATFLCCCLSNHPQVFCVRGEPTHWQDEWYNALPDIYSRLDLMLSQGLYDVSACKILSRYTFEGELWNYIKGYPEMHIIFLRREDLLSQVLSWEVHALQRARGQKPSGHSFVSPERYSVAIDPAAAARRYRSIQNRLAASERTLAAETGLPVLRLTYEQLTQGGEADRIPSDVSKLIYDFLGIEAYPLYTRLRKDNPWSWDEVISNLGEVKGAVEAELEQLERLEQEI